MTWSNISCIAVYLTQFYSLILKKLKFKKVYFTFIVTVSGDPSLIL